MNILFSLFFLYQEVTINIFTSSLRPRAKNFLTKIAQVKRIILRLLVNFDCEKDLFVFFLPNDEALMLKCNKYS